MQKNTSLPDLAGVAAMFFAFFSGGRREKYPGFVRVGRGIGQANLVGWVDRFFKHSAIAFALGCDPLFRADGWLAKGAKFHGGGLIKKPARGGLVKI